MGMFDYVLVEVPIEGVENPAAIEWQSKDFDMPALDQYRITTEGRLMESVYHVEDCGDKSAPPGTFARFIGCMTPVHDYWRDMNYHGDVEFCGNVDGTLACYVARFTEGQLVSISRLPMPNKPDGPSSPSRTPTPHQT